MNCNLYFCQKKKTHTHKGFGREIVIQEWLELQSENHWLLSLVVLKYYLLVESVGKSPGKK